MASPTPFYRAAGVGTVGNVVAQVLPRIGNWLPRGRPLDPDAWARRHRAVVGLLWAHVAGLAVYGVIREVRAVHLLLELGAIAVLTVVAMQVPSRVGQAVAGTLGLISCSALIV